MQPELTKQQQQALDENDGIVEGSSFVIVSIDLFRDLLGFETDEALRDQLQIGFDQANQGRFVDWDPEKIKAEGRRRHNQRSESR